MRRYWQFALVGIICLLVALLWAQPPRSQEHSPAMARTASSAPQAAAAGGTSSAPQSPPATKQASKGAKQDEADPLPGSSSSLPLLAVIGFGVLAGGITSAMRTR